MKAFMERRKSKQETIDPEDDTPPSYFQSVPPQLSFTSNSLSPKPIRLLMRGESRSPDFKVMTNQNEQLFAIETQSTQIAHESNIKDFRSSTNASWFLVRKASGDLQTYTIKKPGSDGAKLLEIQTTSQSMSDSSIRLVFRGWQDGELDALDLQVGPDGPNSPMDLLYQQQKVGQVTQIGSERQPTFQLDIGVSGIDYILFIVFALVIDDRHMTSRRRWSRSATAGAPGLWNGAVRSLPVMALGI